jgi:formiminotetrahydrofolate cyclodeaminase
MDHDLKLEDRTIDTYLDMVASDAPSPGGGSVAAVVGALGSALGEMVINLTDTPHDELVQAGQRLASLRASAVASGAADELAYPAYLEASRMPKTTDEEKTRRKAMMQEAMQEAAAIPMQLAETGIEILETLQAVMLYGNPRVLSDAEVAMIFARACVDASLVNVRVNLAYIRDPETSGHLAGHAHKIEQHAGQLVDSLKKQLAGRSHS